MGVLLSFLDIGSNPYCKGLVSVMTSQEAFFIGAKGKEDLGLLQGICA